MRQRAGDGGNQGTRLGASDRRSPRRDERPARPSGRRMLASAHRPATGVHDPMRRALVLLVAGVWLALAGLALSSGASRAVAAPFVALTSPFTSSPSDSPSPSPSESPSPTPTDTPHPGGTPTPSLTPSTTPTTTATSTATATATVAPPVATNPGDIGPQPTKVVSQLPSSDSGGGGSLGGLTPGAFGSNGLLLATTSSCIVGLLGLLIAAIALAVLLRGGYGPFLKALLRGKRAGQKRDKGAAKGDLAPARANANVASKRAGFGAERDEFGGGGGGWSDPRWSRGDDGPRRGSRSHSHSQSRSRGANHDGW